MLPKYNMEPTASLALTKTIGYLLGACYHRANPASAERFFEIAVHAEMRLNKLTTGPHELDLFGRYPSLWLMEV